MRDIRNLGGSLVCQVDEVNGIIEILNKGCLTQLKWINGKLKIIHIPRKSV